MGQKPGMRPKRDKAHLTQLHIDNFPITLKKDLIEVCEDECSTITEFVKQVLRKEVNIRKQQLAVPQMRA